MKAILPLFCFILFVCPLLSQGQTIRYVKPNGTQAASTATSWANSTSDLQGAINASASGDQVWVAAGVYKPTTSTTDQGANFSMKNGVAIYGGFVGTEANLSERPAINPVSGQPSSTTLSGDIDNDGTLNGNTFNVISNSELNTTAILNGFVITGGNSNGNGGAMTNNVSTPTLTNCSFQGNSAIGRGGAIYNQHSSPIVTNCSFLSNTAPKGGAMYNIYGYPILINCFFKANSASSEGGALDFQSNSATLINCAFLDNQATNGASGGAIFNYSAILRVINCSWQNNTASAGGAIQNFDGTATLTNCVAFGNGGGNTFSSSPNSLTATYSLFEPASITVSGMNVSGAGNLTTTSSPFASTATLALNQCASAINTGNNAAYTSANGPATDLSGQARNYNGSVIDMGAIEYQGSPNLPAGFTTSLASGTAVGTGSAVTVAASVSGTISSYQWYKDGNSLGASQTSATLSLSSVQLSDAGSYSLVVSGACTSLTSTAFSLTVTAPAATRLYVKASASGANTGLTWTDAFPDLQSALNYSASQNLTEIWVAAGTYKPTTSTTDRNARFSMKNGVAIYGGFAGNEANLSDRPAINPVSGQPSSSTLSGDIDNDGTLTGNSYVVIFNVGINSTAILNSFVITGGNSPNNGGAMYNNSSSPTLTNCSFISNAAISNGGAIYNITNSNPTLTNCSFISNAVDNGGAMYNSSSSPTLTNCSFISNAAGSFGGAVYNNNSSKPTLTNCSFQSNTARRGGAMYNQISSNPVLINCAFSSNSASQEGGAINYQTSTATLINCAFLNNQTAGNGGAIFSYGSTLRLINSSFQNNTATSGGAINTFNGVITLTNCVAFGNGGSNTFTNQVNNSNPSGFIATYSLFEPASVTVTGMDVSGPGNLTTTSSPFASTATVALNQCAPAINTGSNAAYSSSSGPATDLSGQARNYNGSVIDMGAVEYQGSPNLQTGFTTQPVASSLVCTGTTVTASVSVSGTGSFTYQWYKDGSIVNSQTAATLSLTNVQTSDGGSYAVAVTGACNSLTSTAFSLTVNAVPSVSINPTSATLTSASPTVSLTAIGTGTYRWSTGETSQVVSVTSSGIYSLTLTTPAGCSASTTANVPGVDLTVALELPQAQFGTSGTAATGNFLVNVFEVGGLATSSGNVTITITAPAGYTLSFVPTLTSIDVSGGSRVAVNNGVWTVSHSVEARQLSLTMNSGAFIGAGGTSSVGLSLTRTTAGSGSTANITVNVADDLTMRYDGNLANNGYARIISGL